MVHLSKIQLAPSLVLNEVLNFSKQLSLKVFGESSTVYFLLPQAESGSPAVSPSRNVSFSDLKTYRLRAPTKRWRLLRWILVVVFLIVIIVVTCVVGRKQRRLGRFSSWRDYKPAPGFYNGLKKLVPISQYEAEYPPTSTYHDSSPSATSSAARKGNGYGPIPYQPYNFNLSGRTSQEGIRQCYLDINNTIPAPDIFAYEAIPQSQPEPVMGSHELLGIQKDVCFERFGRYGPYGLGYNESFGGLGVGNNTENSGNEAIWAQMKKINYTNVDWASAQELCYESNRDRFSSGTLKRSAVVIRLWTGFEWNEFVILNFRAMINELALQSGGEYELHFLVQVKNHEPIWASDDVYQETLRKSVPKEFQGLVTFWSEQQMEAVYSNEFGAGFDNPSGTSVHGVYRSLHMPLQYFAIKHPEYEFFWNWEMDMRYTGHFYEFFDRLGSWTKNQSRQGLWERNAKFYIPALHGPWSNFSRQVQMENEGITVLGPVLFPGSPLNNTHSSCAPGEPRRLCGVGEDADLITLNPMFDPEETGWVFRDDVTGYDTSQPVPPRRVAIITAGRLSKKLLNIMHEETYLHGHAMFAEMFPPAMALHHGLKAVYAPHPVFLDRKWPLHKVEKAFNGGRYGSSGGNTSSPFNVNNEHNFQGSSWYFNAGFAGALWRRWLGYKENGRGGLKSDLDRGRMCLRSVLLHPVKSESGSVS